MAPHEVRQTEDWEVVVVMVVEMRRRRRKRAIENEEESVSGACMWYGVLFGEEVALD